jgi:hypothetical protein
MTLEDEVINKMGADLAREIDKEVLFGMLESIGWTRVLIPMLKTREEYDELIEWLATYCKNPYERRGSDVIFEDGKDANWFILKWGTK